VLLDALHGQNTDIFLILTVLQTPKASAR
jgi:hypothetical protein